MAITILQEPAAFTPAFNDNNWLVSSNNTANANFQFIAEVCDASGTTLFKLKRPVEVGTIKGFFSVGRLIEQYLTFNFGYNDVIPAQNTLSYYRYKIKFGEEYGSTPTEYLNLTASNTVYTWNAALKSYEFPAFAYADWQYDNANTNKGRFLTPIRSNFPTTLNQYGNLWYLQKTSAPANRVNVVAVSSSGSTTTSVFDTNLTTNDPAYALIRIPAHPKSLNSIATLVSGTPGNVIPSDTVRYTIQLLNTASVLGEALTFKVNCESNFSTPIYLYWLNRYGGFDSFVFDGLNKSANETEFKQYTKNQRVMGSSTYNYSADSAGIKNYHTKTQEGITLTTRWLNATEAELLDHVATSPVFYMLKGGVMTAMVLKTSRHEKKTGEEFTAFQYEYELNYALIDFSQRF